VTKELRSEKRPLNCIVCAKPLRDCNGHSVRDLERAWDNPGKQDAPNGSS
jgi:hypothetical protein